MDKEKRAQIRDRVNAAIRLDREIARLDGDLKEIKAELAELAKDKDLVRERTECGGWSVVLHGTSNVARVTKSGSKLKGEIDEKSKEWDELRQLLGPLALILFTPHKARIPAKSIRENIVTQGPEKEKRILKLITTKGTTSVSFETKGGAQ